uniref:Serine/threonine-protein kinase Chk2 n=2 Tax=Cacopsylla melanoneura TaxID=428564 RepID=A0A8D8Z1Y2_9HEMI
MDLFSQQDTNQNDVITQPYECDELPDTPELDVGSAPNSFEFPNLWGTLISIDSGMKHIELSKDEYSFGRDCHQVDCVLRHSSCLDDNFSRKHFTIGFNGSNREAYIIDNSTNGTLVNSDKLVKDVRHHLQHLSRINVISEKNKVFIFLDELKYQEVRSKMSDTILSKYFICDVVGKGCFGTVKLCVQKETKMYLAIKEVENSIDGDNNRKYFASEVANLKAVCHPNIVTLYESFLWRDSIYMVLEYVSGGDLSSKIAECGKLGEPDCRGIVYQIALALQYLHSLHIVHRDLKPANIYNL